MTIVENSERRSIGWQVVRAVAVAVAIAGAVAAVVFGVGRWSEIQGLDYRYVQSIGAGLGHANDMLLASMALLAAVLLGVNGAVGRFLLAAQLVFAIAAAAAVELLLFSLLMNVWSWAWTVRGTDRLREVFLSNASVIPQAAHPWWLLLVGALCASVFGLALLRNRVLRWR